MPPAIVHSIATALLLGSGLIACARVQPVSTSAPTGTGSKSETLCGGPRSLSAAVPRDARMALIAERLWSRTAILRDAAVGLGGGELYARLSLIASGIAGFDPTDAAELRRHGFDPESGLALFSFAKDEEPVLVFGISEPALAEQTLLRLLSRLESTRSTAKVRFQAVPGASGPQIMVGKRAGTEEQTGYLLRGGCLYVRAMSASDPMPALLRVAWWRSDESLELAPGYREATSALGSADFLVYRPDRPEFLTASAETSALGSMAFAVSLLPDSIRMRFWGRRRTPSEAGAGAFPRPDLRSDLAGTLPTGALFWAQTSGSPSLLWRETVRNTKMDPARIGEGLKALFGAEADREVLPSFTGHFGMALYPDTAHLQSPDAPPPGSRTVLLVVGELVAGKERSIEAVLDRGLEKLSKRHATVVERRRVGSFPVWRVAGGRLIAAVRDERLFVALDLPADKGAAVKESADATRLGAKKARPARWPLEATPEELGPLGAVLRPQANARSLRDDLGERAAPVATVGSSIIVSRGAILDIPGLIRTTLRLKGDESTTIEALEGFFQQRPAALQQAVFDWTLREGTVEGELRLPVQPAAPLADLGRPKTLAVFEFECLTCDDREAASHWAGDIAGWAQKLSPELKVIRPNRLARGAEGARELAADSGASLAIYAHAVQMRGPTRYRVGICLVGTRHGGVREVTATGNSLEDLRKAMGESLRQILGPTR